MQTFQPRGVCSKQISFEIENGTLKNISFSGGCSGNLQGICALVKGMPVTEVIHRLQGIQCNGKLTSCPDQLAQALAEAAAAAGNQ